MDFLKLKDIKWTPVNILKAAGIVLVAIFALAFLFRVFAPAVNSVVRNAGGFGVATQGVSPVAYDGGYGGADYAYEEKAAYYSDEDLTLSLTNVGIPTPVPGGTVGDNAEDFEVTEYSVSIETRSKMKTCAEITALKELDYVIFESANEYDKGCNYTFKVAHSNVEEILGVIEALDPNELSESTYTIKRQLDDFTSETEILERKLASINETLESAINAYDEITLLATRTQNAEALAKIIDSKLNIIERLTQERINTTAQLERLLRAKAEQLDRLEYTYFHVNVYENKFVDGEYLKDSWQAAVKNFVRDVNRAVQDVTINLLALLFVLAQYILYFFILLISGKYLWRAVKYIWKK